ncbi:MAG: hypothetical protein WHS38_12375 [Thermodesulforhabdaceae bacterium]
MYSEMVEITLNRNTVDFLSASDLVKVLRRLMERKSEDILSRYLIWIDEFFSQPSEMVIGFLRENNFTLQDMRELAAVVEQLGVGVIKLKEFLE